VLNWWLTTNVRTGPLDSNQFSRATEVTANGLQLVGGEILTRGRGVLKRGRGTVWAQIGVAAQTDASKVHSVLRAFPDTPKPPVQAFRTFTRVACVDDGQARPSTPSQQRESQCQRIPHQSRANAWLSADEGH
jgi:hypothetical protein